MKTDYSMIESVFPWPLPRNFQDKHALDPVLELPVRTKKTINGMLVPWFSNRNDIENWTTKNLDDSANPTGFHFFGHYEYCTAQLTVSR